MASVPGGSRRLSGGIWRPPSDPFRPGPSTGFQPGLDAGGEAATDE